MKTEINPWDGIDPDEFVRQVRDGTYDPNNQTNASKESRAYCEGDSPDQYCSDFSRGWGAIHRGLQMAAMNGTATEFKPLKYCPWCGGLLESSNNLPQSTGSTASQCAEDELMTQSKIRDAEDGIITLPKS
jgi:hypothetical protein